MSRRRRRRRQRSAREAPETTLERDAPKAPCTYTSRVTDDELESGVAARLAQLGIAFERHAHPPVATVEEAVQHWADIDATHCKNLFLRNQKGNRHYLVVLLHANEPTCAPSRTRSATAN